MQEVNRRDIAEVRVWIRQLNIDDEESEKEGQIKIDGRMINIECKGKEDNIGRNEEKKREEMIRKGLGQEENEDKRDKQDEEEDEESSENGENESSEEEVGDLVVKKWRRSGIGQAGEIAN